MDDVKKALALTGNEQHLNAVEEAGRFGIGQGQLIAWLLQYGPSIFNVIMTLINQSKGNPPVNSGNPVTTAPTLPVKV